MYRVSQTCVAHMWLFIEPWTNKKGAWFGKAVLMGFTPLPPLLLNSQWLNIYLGLFYSHAFLRSYLTYLYGSLISLTCSLLKFILDMSGDWNWYSRYTTLYSLYMDKKYVRRYNRADHTLENSTSHWWLKVYAIHIVHTISQVHCTLLHIIVETCRAPVQPLWTNARSTEPRRDRRATSVWRGSSSPHESKTKSKNRNRRLRIAFAVHLANFSFRIPWFRQWSQELTKIHWKTKKYAEYSIIYSCACEIIVDTYEFGGKSRLLLSTVWVGQLVCNI